jgi:hypothetical protein
LRQPFFWDFIIRDTFLSIAETQYVAIAMAIVADSTEMASVPGTVHLVDLDHSIHARHAGNGDIILDPAPSSDPDDPLNWSPRRKLTSSLCTNL